MSNEVRKQDDKNKKPARLSEETMQMLANVIITGVSTAALVISLVTGMKAGRRK